MTVSNSRRARLALAAALLVAGLILAVARLHAGPAPAAPALGPEQVQALRSHALTDAGGQRVRVADLAGRVVVVNFWATWCKPCKNEMPRLDALNAGLPDDAGRVLAVSVDREPERVHRFVAEHALTLPVFVDGPEGLAKDLDLAYLPYTVVLDREGKVAFAGASSSDADWKRLSEVVTQLTGDRALRTAREENGS